MAVSLKASEEGLKKIDQLRREKGWMATDPRWCEAAYTSPKTLTRFRRGQPVQQDTFVNICQAIGIAWENVIDRGSALPSTSIRWELRIEADDTLKDAIFELIKKHSGDATLSLRKLEKGSLVFVLEGSLEGFERMEYLFSEGIVSTLMEAQILGVRPRTVNQPVRLSNWLQNNFEAIWRPPTPALARTLSVTEPNGDSSGNPLRRAKDIQLGPQSAVQLLTQLTPQEQGAVDISIRVYPRQDLVYLPAGLQLIMIDPESGLYEVIEAREQDNWIQLELSGELGEAFMIKLQLGEAVVTEDFII
ncbi:DUF1822 family protein [Leptothoe spongobia]|uniref:DUF1822 family protein n=1 Tax=Leptothoe spongobia TAU-MAC 1115 TaxID=1967444 RepID=A0A947DIB6_9CYAN|nr:DUF1822 family protein [Leptothoe spongobia]MBT9316461.1 DUF1822 family protein [Leptothoe spongobia TAU-MAC 1115]